MMETPLKYSLKIVCLKNCKNRYERKIHGIEL